MSGIPDIGHSKLSKYIINGSVLHYVPKPFKKFLTLKIVKMLHFVDVLSKTVEMSNSKKNWEFFYNETCSVRTVVIRSIFLSKSRKFKNSLSSKNLKTSLQTFTFLRN